MEPFKEIIHPIVSDRLTKYADENGISFDDACVRIKEMIGDIVKKYLSGQEEDIDYNDPLTRHAYLYCLVPGLSACFSEILLQSKSYDLFKDLNEIRCLVFGGGPGTELIAMAELFEDKKINFFLTDKEKRWYDCWYEIRDRIAKLLPNRNIISDSLNIDLCNADDFKSIEYSTQNAQFVFFNFVISELYKLKDSFLNFLVEVFNNLPSGAVIIIVDRNQIEIVNFIKGIVKQFDLENINDWVRDCRTQENFEGELVEKIGQPKGSPFNTYQVIAKKK